MRFHTLLATAAACALCITSAAAATNSVTVQMKAQHGSGEAGVATLTQTAGGVRVEVSVKNAPSADQPTHIHPGTCAKLNPAPEYPLSPLHDGKSVTTLSGMKLSQLTGGKYSVNVHKSANDLKDYVSCGEIK